MSAGPRRRIPAARFFFSTYPALSASTEDFSAVSINSPYCCADAGTLNMNLWPTPNASWGIDFYLFASVCTKRQKAAHLFDYRYGCACRHELSTRKRFARLLGRRPGLQCWCSHFFGPRLFSLSKPSCRQFRLSASIMVATSALFALPQRIVEATQFSWRWCFLIAALRRHSFAGPGCMDSTRSG